MQILVSNSEPDAILAHLREHVRYGEGSEALKFVDMDEKISGEMCGGPKAHRHLKYTKGDGSTGRLLLCETCADAWKAERGEDGVWTLTVDLEKI